MLLLVFLRLPRHRVSAGDRCSGFPISGFRALRLRVLGFTVQGFVGSRL